VVNTGTEIRRPIDLKLREILTDGQSELGNTLFYRSGNRPTEQVDGGGSDNRPFELMLPFVEETVFPWLP
jgi:hypothetical protein